MSMLYQASKEAVRTVLEKPWISSVDILATELGIRRDQFNEVIKPYDMEYINQVFEDRKNTSESIEKMIGVVDASVVGYPNFLNYLRENFEMVVMTDLTVNELNWLKDQQNEKNSLSAQALLKQATTDKKFFKLEKLKNKDCKLDSDMKIIQFVKTLNYPNVTLITADAGMSLRAELEHVKCILLEKIDYDRMKKLKIEEIFNCGIVQDIQGVIVKNAMGYNVSLPHKLVLEDEIFLLTREKFHGKELTIFKHLKVVSEDEVASIKKIFIKDNESCSLFNYEGNQKLELMEFIEEFRTNHAKKI